MKIRDLANIFNSVGAGYDAHAIYEFLAVINAEITADTDREIDFNLPSGIQGIFMVAEEGNYVLLFNKSIERTYCFFSNGEVYISTDNGHFVRSYNVRS